MGSKATAGLTPGMVNGGGNGTSGMTVKVGPAAGKYGTTRPVAKHLKTGQEIMVEGQPLALPCQAEKALLGSWLKHLIRKAGLPVRWDEHDAALFDELVSDHAWVEHGGEHDEPKLISGERVKAVLDDAISGGSTLNPVILDDWIFANLLIMSELAPFVDVRDVARGRIVRTGLVGRAQATWGTPDGAAMSLFDTTNLIGSVDTTIYDLKGAIEYGNDLADDVSVSLADMLVQGISEKMLAQLDSAISVGDGTSMPMGLFNSSGVVTVPATNGPPGPVVIADLESLIFGVSKPYRSPMLGSAFVGNDVNYRRFRTIPVGTGFNERVFGSDLMNYSLYGYPYRLSVDAPNNKVMFVALKRYRLWRRLGIQTRIVTTGKELALKNLSLIVAVARYGGRLLDGNGASVIVDLPA